MCGICGYVCESGVIEQGRGLSMLGSMSAHLEHRGPDGEGVWQGDSTGLAHRRLSIIDIEGGQQPMSSLDERYVIAFNGEIYNFQELKAELVQLGYKFITQSDTEVIPAVIDAYGPEDGLRKLRGMFAFALADKKEKTLLLARDYVGIKPLYFSVPHNGQVLFSSEINSLLAAGETPTSLDLSAILDFLVIGHVLAPSTGLSHVRELEPGSYVLIDADLKLTEKRFWNWRDSNTRDKGSAILDRQAWVDETQSTLLDSIKAHMVSDVPVSAFLSGGVDSSVISAMVCRHLKPGLATFNVGFADTEYDESPYARAVAEHIGSEHHEISMDMNSGAASMLQSLMQRFGQPFGDSSAIPSYLIAGRMSQHAKVVLSGDGGDEMFAGYDRYIRANDIERLKRLPFSSPIVAAVSKAISCVDQNKSRQFNKLGSLLSKPYTGRLLAQLTYFAASEFEEILVPELHEFALEEYESQVSRYLQPSESAEEDLVDFEIEGMLHADYLKKIDICSMAHGLEVRTPFLDKSIMSLSRAMPMQVKRYRRTGKYPLKKVAEGYLPHHVLYRKKQGFGIPFDKWAGDGELKSFIHDMLGIDARINSIVNHAYVKTLLSAFFGNVNETLISRYQVYQRVYMLLSLEVWLRGLPAKGTKASNSS